MEKKPFILVDGSSYLYRAFHALPPLHNSKGEPTGAVYGVASMLRKLLQEYDPEYIAVVFDAKGKTFRDDLYAQYKANRPVMPDELQQQIEPLHELIQAMGIPLIMIEGCEADDVIGTLAKQAFDAGMNTLISTGDKDIAQLVNPYITLINTMTNTLLDREGVIKKFGVPPELIIDYLTLIGDSVDNVPGVPNVGPKTAVKWLEQYGNLDNVIACASEIKGKVGDNLRATVDQLPLSRELVTIKQDIVLSQHVTDLRRVTPNNSKLIDLLKKLEFKSWLSDLLSVDGAPAMKEKNYHMIVDEEAFGEWVKRLEQAELFAFDTETTDLDVINAEIVGVSFAIHPHEAAYVPLAHDYEHAPKQLSREKVLKKLKPLLESSRPKIIGHNVKYDLNVLANYDITLKAIACDTMLESYVLQSGANRHDMDSLALKYLGHKTITFEDIAGKGSKQLHFNEIPLEQAAPYAAEDADITLQLHQTLWPQIETNKGLRKTLCDIEIPLLSVLAHMERYGVLIDAHKLQQQSVELSKRIKELEDQAYVIAGQVFNLSSPKQLQEIFYEQLKLPVLEKTPSGQPSTAESVLQELALNYPLPKLILEYRSLSKLKSTYTDRLPEQIHSRTGRVHTSYNQAVTSTGRLSSTDPNLQNIPVRTTEGRRIRAAFIAPKGYKIVSADYSQIELRIMAHLSKDDGLRDAFSQGLDIHRATAAEIFNVDLDKVTSEQRRRAKAINFGLIYGMSAFGLSKQLGIERQAAQIYMDVYFHRYPNVKIYMENARRQARERGYVETLFGRRLYLPEINSRNLQRQKAAERAAINAPMQGTAADIIKFAMIKIDEWLRKKKIDAHMIMQVHDELVFEVKENDVNIFVDEVKKYMCETIKLSVPITVDVGVGNNWFEAHD